MGEVSFATKVPEDDIFKNMGSDNIVSRDDVLFEEQVSIRAYSSPTGERKPLNFVKHSVEVRGDDLDMRLIGCKKEGCFLVMKRVEGAD